MSTPVTTETLREVLDGFNDHDLDAIMEHFADDCVFGAPRGPERWDPADRSAAGVSM